MEDNHMSVFKSYLRAEIKLQKEIQAALDEGDIEKAKTLIAEMIARTQESIED